MVVWNPLLSQALSILPILPQSVDPTLDSALNLFLHLRYYLKLSNLRGLHYHMILVYIDLKFKCLFININHFLLSIIMFSPISDVSLSLSLSFLILVFNFSRVNELGSSTLLMNDIDYEKTPLSLGEFNQSLGLFLTHQEIDSAQHKRLGEVIFPLRPTQLVRWLSDKFN